MFLSRWLMRIFRSIPLIICCVVISISTSKATSYDVAQWSPITLALTVQSYGDFTNSRTNVPSSDKNGNYTYADNYANRWNDKAQKFGNKEFLSLLIQAQILYGSFSDWVLYAKSSKAGVDFKGPVNANYDECFAYNNKNQDQVDLSNFISIQSLTTTDFPLTASTVFNYVSYDYSSQYQSGFQYTTRFGKSSKIPPIYAYNGSYALTLNLQSQLGISGWGYGAFSGTWSEIVWYPTTNNFSALNTLLLPGACSLKGIIGQAQDNGSVSGTPVGILLSGSVTLGAAKAIKY